MSRGLEQVGVSLENTTDIPKSRPFRPEPRDIVHPFPSFMRITGNTGSKQPGKQGTPRGTSTLPATHELLEGMKTCPLGTHSLQVLCSLSVHFTSLPNSGILPVSSQR